MNSRGEKEGGIFIISNTCQFLNSKDFNNIHIHHKMLEYFPLNYNLSKGETDHIKRNSQCCSIMKLECDRSL